jgi:hypothetical protein
MPVLTYLDLLGLPVIESHQNLARNSNTSPHVSNSPSPNNIMHNQRYPCTDSPTRVTIAREASNEQNT